MKDRIRKVMETQNMTQQEFAEFLHISPASLSSIFTGRTRPTLSIVEAIKKSLPDISTDHLLATVPSRKAGAHLVHLAVPDALGVDDEAFLEDVLAQHQALLARS